MLNQTPRESPCYGAASEEVLVHVHPRDAAEDPKSPDPEEPWCQHLAGGCRMGRGLRSPNVGVLPGPFLREKAKGG